MKQLTGKAKEDFYEWLLNEHYPYKVWRENEFFVELGVKPRVARLKVVMKLFKRMPQSAQFGLIQEWGDSVGYELEANRSCFVIYDVDYNGYVKECNSRPEAQREAVKKLSEIYNK